MTTYYTVTYMQGGRGRTAVLSATELAALRLAATISRGAIHGVTAHLIGGE